MAFPTTDAIREREVEFMHQFRKAAPPMPDAVFEICQRLVRQMLVVC
jgi:hypothetical protein